METHDLATELVEFWAPLLADEDWEKRQTLLAEIHEQIREDITDDAAYREVSLRLVTGLIDRLGAPPITNAHQAHIYANSGDERHWRAARAWFRANRGPRRTPWRARRRRASKRGGERRSGSRQTLHLTADVVSRGQRVTCKLVNLSPQGALLALSNPPEVGTQIRITLPGRGALTASIVRRGPGFAAVAFPGRPPSTPIHGAPF